MPEWKNKIKLVLPVLSLLALAVFAFPAENAMAEDRGGHGLKATGRASEMDQLSADLPTIIGGIVNALLGIVGVIFLILVIYGGFLWMTAGGNEETVKKARSLIIGAIAGMVIIFMAYAITQFVIEAVVPESQSTGQEDAVAPGEDPLEELIDGSDEE